MKRLKKNDEQVPCECACPRVDLSHVTSEVLVTEVQGRLNTFITTNCSAEVLKQSLGASWSFVERIDNRSDPLRLRLFGQQGFLIVWRAGVSREEALKALSLL